MSVDNFVTQAITASTENVSVVVLLALIIALALVCCAMVIVIKSDVGINLAVITFFAGLSLMFLLPKSERQADDTLTAAAIAKAQISVANKQGQYVDLPKLLKQHPKLTKISKGLSVETDRDDRFIVTTDNGSGCKLVVIQRQARWSDKCQNSKQINKQLGLRLQQKG